MVEKARVAVIGLGACGLVALKNLRQAGFDAIGFESNPYVGGLWKFTDDPTKTSVLRTTITNLSKPLGCYTDFPFPDDVPVFPTGADLSKYLVDYAEHFDLMPFARLETEVTQISEASDGWVVKTKEKGDEKVHEAVFDRVIVATGLQVQSPKIPTIKGRESFTGRAIHSQAYKRPSDFDGRRVVVVGLGNTGPDTAVDLIGHASDIWLSHRSGNAIFSRRNPRGKPADHILTLRLAKMGGFFTKYFPNLSMRMSTIGMKRIQNQAFSIKPEWNLGPIPLPNRKVPTMSEELIPALHAEKLHLVPGLTEINGSTLSFSDGSTLEAIDAIIFCTGYRADFSVLDSAADPTKKTRPDWHKLPGSNDRPLPRLYQGIFHPEFSNSLAILGTSPLTPQACLNYDISSAAVAQIWLGHSSLPSVEEMNAHIDAQHEVVCQIARTGELANTNLRNNWEWFEWCDETAGLGLVKRVGYGFEGWKFWWRDRKLCSLVMNGLMSPHLFRLFDEGKREPWDGARRAVETANGVK